MSNPVTFGGLWKQIKRLFILWLVLALAAALAVIGGRYLSLPARFQATAQIQLDFPGIEKGQDLNGNRFDIREIRAESVLIPALEKAGLSTDQADPEAVAHALAISSVTPANTLSRITKPGSSLLTGDKIEGKNEKISDYYPTRYKVTLNYGALGLDAAAGNALFRAILEAAVEQFTQKYGVPSAPVEAAGEAIPEDLDFEGRAAWLDSRLEGLSRVVLRLAAEDTGNFRAAETGLSFRDLQAELTSLKDRDLKNLSRWISNRHVSADPARQELEYRYLAEEAQLKSQAWKERLDRLTRLAANYTPRKDIVVGAAGALSPTLASQGELPFSTETHELVQRSAVEESLTALRLRLQSELSEAQDADASYRAWLSAKAEPTDADKAYADAELARISERLRSLAESLQKTAEEYDRTVRLNRTFRVTGVTEGENLPVRRLLRASLPDLAAAEAGLFGLFILLAACLACFDGRSRRTA